MALIPTSTAIVQSFAGALYGKQIGTTTMAAVNRDVTSLGLNATLNSYFTYSFGSMTAAQVADLVVTNLGIVTGKDNAAAYVVGQLNSAKSAVWGQTISSILQAFSGLTADATYGAAATAWNTQVEAAAAYAGASDVAIGAVVSTFTLTAGVDIVTTTSGNDVINATDATFTGLDAIAAGAGNDTLNIADGTAPAATTLYVPAGVTVTGVETLNVSSNQNLGTDRGSSPTPYDVSGFAGLKTANFVTGATASNTESSWVKVANDVTVNATTLATGLTVTGGVNVTLTNKSATVPLYASGAKLQAASFIGGSDVSADDYDSVAAASAGTLTAVTVSETSDTAAAFAGSALTTLNVGKQATAASFTIDQTGAAADLDFTLTVADSGKVGSSPAVVTLVNNTAKSVAITAGGTANNVKIDSDASLKAVTVAGAGALTLDVDGSGNTALASINGSAATGALTLSNIPAAAVTVKTGTGKDAFTLTATAKATVDAGAGDDTVTLGSALAAGSSVSLGDGNDKLLSSSGSVAASTVASGSTPAAITTVDGGAGTDLLAASLVTAGNGAQFVNFETLGLTNNTLDASLLTGSTLTGLELLAGGGTYTNVTAAQSLAVNTNTSGTTTLTFSGVTGTADAYTINFGSINTATPTASNTSAGELVLTGIENINIVSGGTKAWNSVLLGADTSANTVVVTGASNLDFGFNTGFGSTTAPKTGVSLIDGSAATGKLALDTTGVVAATAGLTVKGGSAADTIVLAGAATVLAGDGADTITTAAAGGTLTGGAGADTFVVAASTGTAPTVTITDLAVGDKIDLAGTIAAAGTLGAKVDVGAAVSLATALEIANGSTGTRSTTALSWFQYAGNTYVYADLPATGPVSGTLDAGDNIVKITGLIDLSTSTYTTGAILTVVTV
jgi:hypothetical protein